MKISIHTDGVIITAKQKSLMEKKLARMKKFVTDQTFTVNVNLKDETSAEKGGVDQSVSISASFAKEKIFIEETDDRLMRAFVFALKRLERQLTRFHKRGIDKTKRGGGGRLEKIWKYVKIPKLRRKGKRIK